MSASVPAAEEAKAAPVVPAGYPDADVIAATVLGCRDVVRLSGGAFGEVATYLPGRRVVGVSLRPDGLSVHVVARYGAAAAGGLRPDPPDARSSGRRASGRGRHRRPGVDPGLTERSAKHRGRPLVMSFEERIVAMSLGDKIDNKSEELAGKGKQVAGNATGDDELKAEGERDEAKGNLKQAGEKIKDVFKS